MGFISNPPPPLFFLSQVKPAIPLSISRWFYGIGGVLVVLWLWIRDNWTSCMLTLINMLMLIIWLNDILGLNFLWSLMELGWRRRCDGCGSEEIGHRGRLMVPGKDFEWISEEISRYLFVVLETLLVPTICSCWYLLFVVIVKVFTICIQTAILKQNGPFISLGSKYVQSVDSGSPWWKTSTYLRVFCL